MKSKAAWLLDVNVLLAMAWPQHIHHELAHRWFFDIRNRPWASCAVTELAFVRLSSNPKFTADAVPPVEAIALLKEMCSGTNHRYLPDTTSPSAAKLFQQPGLVGHRQVTDVYLLALASRESTQLATLDRALGAFAAARAAPAEWIGQP